MANGVEGTPAESPAGVVSGPLTNAERQKRHREKDPDGYRKRNRERMQRKRAK